MKILLVCSYYPPIQSGSSFYTETLARKLTEQGHEVGVVTVDWGRERVKNEDWPVEYLKALIAPPLPVFLNTKLLSFVTPIPRNYRVFNKILDTFQPDIIHQVSHIFDTAFLSAILGHRRKIPVVCTSTIQIHHNNPVIDKMMQIADRLLLGNFMVKYWDRALHMDSELWRYMQNAYGKEMIDPISEIVAYGLPSEFQPFLDKTYEDPEDGNYRILSLGHLHEFRNRLDLIEAMAIVKEKYPNAELLIAGRVHFNKPVELAKKLGLEGNTVKFLGEIPYSQTTEYFKTCHLHAVWFGLEYTGLGTAAIESMASGLPLVGSTPENLFGPKTLTSWENFVKIEVGNPQQIADSIIRLFEDRDLREKIGRNGQKFVLDYLDWTRLTENLVRIYQDVLEGRPVQGDGGIGEL